MPRVGELNGMWLWSVRSCLLLLNLSLSREWKACSAWISIAVPIRFVDWSRILICFHFLHHSIWLLYYSRLCSFIANCYGFAKSRSKTAHHTVWKKPLQWRTIRPQCAFHLMRISGFSALHWDVPLIQKRPDLNWRVSFCLPLSRFVLHCALTLSPCLPSSYLSSCTHFMQ